MSEIELCQYYYTSYRHARTGRGGFQVKALSPGITNRTQAAIARLIAYRISPDLDVQAYQTHPIALRYHRDEDTDICVLLCSQSCGSDEYGRPGNFFAHAVSGERSCFQQIPPICCWQSAFWQAQDVQERDPLDSLPKIRTIESGKELTIDAIWRFLEPGKRRELCYRLLCAVVQSHATQRRIIIVDSAQCVACWIAAVSYLLPPRWRTLLTFATYHHDPRQAPYLLTGVDKSVSERILRDEESYFVLHASREQASPVADSPYARLALEAASPGRYEEQMLPLFAQAERLLPSPQRIDQQLDMLALYALTKQSAHKLTAQEREFVHQMLHSSQALPPEIEEAFFLAVCDSFALAHSSQSEIALCKRYHQHSALPQSARAVVESLVALSAGDISEAQVMAVRQSVADLAPEQYREMLARWIAPYVRQAVSQAMYPRLVQALLVQKRTLNQDFWCLYLETLQNLFHQEGLSQRVIWMLDSYFVLTPSSLPGEYMLQQGFMMLGASALLQERNFAQALLKATQYPWQTSLLLVCGRSRLAQVRASLLAGMRKRAPQKEQQEAAREGEISKSFASARQAIVWLFEEEQMLKRHRQLLDIHPEEDPHAFWSAYWRKLLALLQAGSIDLWLDILAFWSQDAYVCLAHRSYLPQEFWTGLPGLLQRATRSPMGRQGISILSQRIASQTGQTGWGEYILPYLEI